MNGREEVWPPCSLSFLLPSSLICFIFYPLMWLMSGQTVCVSGKREVPFRPHPEPRTSSLGCLTLTAQAADGTCILCSLAVVLCNFSGKESCLKGGPQVPRPLCLTGHQAHRKHSNIELIERAQSLSHLWRIKVWGLMLPQWHSIRNSCITENSLRAPSWVEVSLLHKRLLVIWTGF